ncbi:tetratricopeptide repeat protein [Streptomyces sp. SID5474]|nr:tetratricopeptide repeat protein [Streptomyces sp. SID5474]
MQAGHVSGGVHFHGHSAQVSSERSPIPRQLPGDGRGFINRVEDLRRLDAILSGDDDSAPASLCVIAGTAGVGKTSLALRWAHQAKRHFPDGQLYVNLRGYDSGEPVSAADLLPRFLASLGLPAAAVPTEVEAAAALYRSLLAQRRMLIVLDNAATIAQVRPLLPGTAHCLTLVTTRGRLSGLAIRDGAYRLTLDTLAEPEAVALLRGVTAGRRTDDAVELAELARLCAHLPLALRIAAERAADRPHMRLDELIADLRDESVLWDALSTGDEEEAEAVRAVFTWSYQALSPDAARMFRLLGLHPGCDFGIGVVAALSGASVRRSRQLLDALVGAHLLEQTAPDRFEFHDLLRAYAHDQAQREETPEACSAVLRRMLDWYLHTADAAQSWLRPAEDHIPMDPLDGDVEPLSFLDYDQAVDWAEREQANFVPVVRAAEKAGLDRYAWQLPAVLWYAKAPSSLTADWLTAGRIGLEAARRLGDRRAEASLLENLGFGCTKINRLAEGLDRHRDALAIRRELRDREGEATSLNALGLVHLRNRDFDLAEARLERAAEVFAELGEDHWQNVAITNRALVRYQAGRLTEAAADLDRVLPAHRRRGDQRSIGNALWLLSAVRLDRGEPDGALCAAQEAVKLALDLRSHVLEGCWLLALGNAQLALGRFGDALVSYHRSANLHRRLGDHSREALGWQGAGDTYRRLDRAAEAADFHRRAAAAHRALADAWNEALALDGLGVALREEDPDQSLRYWAESVRLLAPYDDLRAREKCRDIERRLANPAHDD